METAASPSPAIAKAPEPRWRYWTRTILFVKLRLILTGILLGYLYGWASPLVYPKDRPLGFAYGFAHGGLMPMAMPSLIMGKNVDIFANNNNGQFYKLGYICGINVCGLIFFGLGFGGLPKRKPKIEAEALSKKLK